MGVPARGPLGYAGTKLGMIVTIALVGEKAVQQYIAGPVNWAVLLPLAAYRLNKFEAEELARRQRGG